MECSVCFELKKSKEFFTFRCNHSVCQSCYNKIQDKNRCFYCRQEIVDETLCKQFDKVFFLYLAIVIFDLFYTSIIFIMFTVKRSLFAILFYSEMIYAALLIILLNFFCFDKPPVLYNFVMILFKLSWIVLLCIVEKVVWKMTILSISKLFLIYVTCVLEYYRYQIRTFFNYSNIKNYRLGGGHL